PGAVIQLRDPVRTLEALGRSRVAAVNEDLAHRVMRLLSRHAGGDRLDSGIERLQDGGVHAFDVVAYLSNDNGASEVTVEVGLPARGKDVDDHRRVGLDRTGAAVMGQGTL